MDAEQRCKLDAFYAATEKTALIQAHIACGSREDAFDIVQDAMIKLAKAYPTRSSEWPALFQRILQNVIRDFYRRKRVRRILLFWESTSRSEDSEASDGSITVELDQLAVGSRQEQPEVLAASAQLKTRLARALQKLPLRQQQAFILRAWHNYSTEEAATAMECSAGSVKSHYSRALTQLRKHPQLLELESAKH